MRIQVEVDPKNKDAAEAHAISLGYYSLSAMLRVYVRTLAKVHLSGTSDLPSPENFSHWPDHITPEVAKNDPELYKFLIEIKQIW